SQVVVRVVPGEDLAEETAEASDKRRVGDSDDGKSCGWIDGSCDNVRRSGNPVVLQTAHEVERRKQLALGAEQLNLRVLDVDLSLRNLGPVGERDRDQVLNRSHRLDIGDAERVGWDNARFGDGRT